MVFKLWSIKNYAGFTNDDIKKKALEYENLNEILTDLEENNYYHFRIFKNNIYTFFADIDGYKKDIEDYIKIFKNFMEIKYNIKFTHYSYTKNDDKYGSYHLSIPEWNASTEKLKEIFQNFYNETKNNDDFNYVDNDGKKIKSIDTTIYSDHWFRCPNQTKGNDNRGIHIIKKGELKDFIIDFIDEDSKNIDDIKYIENDVKKDEQTYEKNIVKKSILKNLEEKKEENVIDDVEQINFKIEIITELINLLNNEYYEPYDNWRNVGMILKKTTHKYNYDFFYLFEIFSKKSNKYNEEKNKKIWDSFDANKITINEASLYIYARISCINDNKIGEYKLLMRKINNFQRIDITEKYIVKMLYSVAGQYFVFKNKVLYSYDKKNKRWFEEDTDIMNVYINDDLFEHIYSLLTDSIVDEKYLNVQIKNLKNYTIKNTSRLEIIKAYQTRYSNNFYDIVFNEHPFLLGFTNGVYDMEKKEFRDYKHDDYITTSTGYAYKKGTKQEIEGAEEIINKIETNDVKRNFLYQILGSGFIGLHFRKFFIFNGSGRNGKSKIRDIMELLLGNYFLGLNNSFLLGKEKDIDTTNEHTAGKNMLNQKRFLVCSEPSKNQKIQNNKMKDLTGNETFTGRKMRTEGTFIIRNTGTYIMECNEKPLLAEEPTEADIDRICDYLFESKFLTSGI